MVKLNCTKLNFEIKKR